MLRPIVSVLAGACLALAGCGPTCQSACNRLYATTGDSCGIERAGTEASDLIGLCMDVCTKALETPGEVDGYDPNNRTNQDAETLLTNEKRAALWLDCVNGTSCDALVDGYCEPVW